VHLGASVSVTEQAVAQALDALMRNPGKLRAMSETALALVDGNGAARVCEAMAEAYP